MVDITPVPPELKKNKSEEDSYAEEVRTPEMVLIVCPFTNMLLAITNLQL